MECVASALCRRASMRRLWGVEYISPLAGRCVHAMQEPERADDAERVRPDFFLSLSPWPPAIQLDVEYRGRGRNSLVQNSQQVLWIVKGAGALVAVVQH